MNMGSLVGGLYGSTPGWLGGSVPLPGTQQNPNPAAPAGLYGADSFETRSGAGHFTPGPGSSPGTYIGPSTPSPGAPPALPPPAGSPPTDKSPQAGVLSGPGYGEQWYQLYGNDINQATNTQKLFDQGPGATNPLYDNAIDMTNRQINAQTAGRGIYDSSAALGSIGLADASLRGQQVKDYENLGATADAANTGKYTAASNAAHMAQNDTEQRVNSIVGGQTTLSTSQANTISNFYDMAEKGQLTADMASIEAQIQASGVDAATAQALTNDILQAGGIAAKAGAGK